MKPAEPTVMPVLVRLVAVSASASPVTRNGFGASVSGS
jgi:hypothetical protein